MYDWNLFGGSGRDAGIWQVPHMVDDSLAFRYLTELLVALLCDVQTLV